MTHVVKCLPSTLLPRQALRLPHGQVPASHTLPHLRVVWLDNKCVDVGQCINDGVRVWLEVLLLHLARHGAAVAQDQVDLRANHRR